MFHGFSGRHGLALVRIVIGALFIASAWDKTIKGWFVNPQPMVASIQPNLDNAEPFYRPFLEGTVLADPLTFSRAIALGEWVVGISFLLGFLTRIGAISALLLLFNYMSMKGTLLGQYNVGPTYSDRVYFIAALGFLLAGGAAIAWALDRVIARWAEDVPVIRHLFGHRPLARVPIATSTPGTAARPEPVRLRPRAGDVTRRAA